MRAKLDENLGRSCAALLADGGHDVATVLGQGMASWSDGALLEACREEGRVLVTLDMDFSNPLRFPPEGTPGIAVLDAALSDNPIAGRLWIVQPGTVREYERPT